jgi:hypothetical protein
MAINYTPTGVGTKHCVTMGELAKLVNRMPGTVRQWEREGYLPDDLRSVRSAGGWRYWTKEQAAAIIVWSSKRYPGSTFEWYKPTKEEVDKVLKGMRMPENDAALKS